MTMCSVATKIATERWTKNKTWKKEFEVATIVYFGKLWKNQKDKTRYAKKPDFGSESRLRVGKVLAPHIVRPKTVPLIKYAKKMWFSKYFKIKGCKNYFLGFLGPTRISNIFENLFI